MTLCALLQVGSLFGVKGKTVLVTGGATGIGLMIAAGFVAGPRAFPSLPVSFIEAPSRDDCQ